MDSPEIQRLVDKLKDQVVPTDPVKVQGQVRAYLLQRGRHVADDMDLGPASDEYLIDLGQLDVMAEHPDMTPGLAANLEQIVDQRRRESTYPSTGCTGCDMGPARHWPCTNPHGMHDYRVLTGDPPSPADDDDPSPDPAPEHDWKPEGPRSERIERPTATGRGQAAAVARAEGKRGKIDPIKQYLRDVPDPDDDDWTPT